MFLHLSPGYNWGPNVVLFCFHFIWFFSRIIIVIFHKTLAHLKIWDSDLLIQVKLFSKTAQPRSIQRRPFMLSAVFSLDHSWTSAEFMALYWRPLLTYFTLYSPTSSMFHGSFLDFDNSGVSINNQYSLLSLLTDFYTLVNYWLRLLFHPLNSSLKWRSFFQLPLRIQRPRIIESVLHKS